MTFLWPAMLWLGVLIPVVAGAYVLMQRRRKKQALRYARLALVRNAQGAAPRPGRPIARPAW
jgi:Ca-activated chloride channel family protein